MRWWLMIGVVVVATSTMTLSRRGSDGCPDREFLPCVIKLRSQRVPFNRNLIQVVFAIDSEAKLLHTCKAYGDVMPCFRNRIVDCGNDKQRQMLAEVRRLLMYLCSPFSLQVQQDFVKHSRCISAVLRQPTTTDCDIGAHPLTEQLENCKAECDRSKEFVCLMKTWVSQQSACSVFAIEQSCGDAATKFYVELQRAVFEKRFPIVCDHRSVSATNVSFGQEPLTAPITTSSTTMTTTTTTTDAPMTTTTTSSVQATTTTPYEVFTWPAIPVTYHQPNTTKIYTTGFMPTTTAVWLPTATTVPLTWPRFTPPTRILRPSFTEPTVPPISTKVDNSALKPLSYWYKRFISPIERIFSRDRKPLTNVIIRSTTGRPMVSRTPFRASWSYRMTTVAVKPNEEFRVKKKGRPPIYLHNWRRLIPTMTKSQYHQTTTTLRPSSVYFFTTPPYKWTTTTPRMPWLPWYLRSSADQ